VEKIVDYFSERPEESSFLYLVNLGRILIGNATLYLSIPNREPDSTLLSLSLHFLMRAKIRAFHNSS
jgi:hypothetical protein